MWETDTVVLGREIDLNNNVDKGYRNKTDINK